MCDSTGDENISFKLLQLLYAEKEESNYDLITSLKYKENMVNNHNNLNKKEIPPKLKIYNTENDELKIKKLLKMEKVVDKDKENLMSFYNKKTNLKTSNKSKFNENLIIKPVFQEMINLQQIQDLNSNLTINFNKQINYTRYKTELCRQYNENGFCKYGEKCQFAHGLHELKNINRHPKYKTDLCKTFHSKGFCPYGPRCHFIHQSDEKHENINILTNQLKKNINIEIDNNQIQQITSKLDKNELNKKNSKLMDDFSSISSGSLSPTSSSNSYSLFSSSMSSTTSSYQSSPYNNNKKYNDEPPSEKSFESFTTNILMQYLYSKLYNNGLISIEKDSIGKGSIEQRNITQNCDINKKNFQNNKTLETNFLNNSTINLKQFQLSDSFSKSRKNHQQLLMY